jgi:hypothetical protein
LDKAIKVDGDLLSTIERSNLLQAMESLEQRLTDEDQDAIVERKKMLESMSVPFATRRVERLVGEVVNVSSSSEK